MNPADYKKLVDLISLYGSAQFWRGANNNDAYDKLTAEAEQYFKQILVFLNKV